MSFEKTESVKFPNIAADIKKMVDADQDMRGRQTLEEDYWDEELDIKNTEKMKAIVSEIGWPTVSKVGKERSSDAWLLVQHADHDVDFQLHCLQLMKEAEAGEVDITEIAYLEDRVRVNQGRGQLYGTQFTQKNGEHIPEPIEDEESVDERRSSVGMGPLVEQIQHMYDRYPFDNKV